MKDKKITQKVIAALIAVLVIFSGGYVIVEYDNAPEKETTTVTTTEASTVIEEVTVSDELLEIVESVEEQIENDESVETNDVLVAPPSEEKQINDEGLLETDGVIEQENISYDGTNDKSGKNLLSGAPKLTYYSQADSRWGSIMYSNHGDKSQTIRSSGCGPTSAAMVITASKGVIIPPATAQLFKDNNMRTTNNGTAWNAWPFIADYFDFNEYHSTSSFSTMTSYLKQDKNKDGEADYFVVASCGSGLFTTGGHYIFLAGDKDGVITVCDPYYYVGKFTTASRRAAAVKTDGNIAYVTESNFKKYGAVKQYWIYSNDSEEARKDFETTTKAKPDVSKTKTKTMYVNTKSGRLNVRNKPSLKGVIVKTLKRGTKVSVYETKNGWSRIGENEWVDSDYLSSKKPTIVIAYSTEVGKTYKFTDSTNLYSKPTLSGTVYSYKSNTTFKVISHYSATVDKIYIPATGREAYWEVGNFK
ncbi:MAG: SH3 domain-containing protein [Eubacterium sp.]|nr:SH3 domain-containing protein [Eubacterium sp.]